MVRKPCEQAIIQNLRDAGCDEGTVEQFLHSQRCQQLKLLAVHRKKLLDRVHLEQRRIDCLDYLVWQLQKQTEEESSYEHHRTENL